MFRFTEVSVMCVALAIACAPGCKSQPRVTEVLLAAGSTTMKSYMEPLEKAFEAKHPTADVVLEAGGTTAGIVALKRAAIDVALVGRDLSNDEDDQEMQNYLVARDGLAIVVHPSNPIADISTKRLAEIYMGEVRSWKDVGAANAPDGDITVVVPDISVRARKSFFDIVMDGQETAPIAVVAQGAGALVEMVKSNPRAIGYLASVDASPQVKRIKVNGVEMTRATILSSRYPLSRSFYLTLYRPNALAERFVEFAISAEGQSLLAGAGLERVY